MRPVISSFTLLVLGLAIGYFVSRETHMPFSSGQGRLDAPPGRADDLGDYSNPVSVQSAAFPLRVSSNGRHLVDREGRPFLVVGDAAWSLLVQPSEEDIDRYLDNRASKGFNCIIVNLVEHKHCANPPKTRAGLSPFIEEGDFAKPNPAYFDFAHRIVKKAKDRGMVVWLFPAYLGYNGGDEGWFKWVKAGGRARARQYGHFVGDRFKDLTNIVWVVGGDYTPAEADRWTASEIAEGILEADPRHLISGHGIRGDSATAAFGNPSWLTINSTYASEKALLRLLREDYLNAPPRPFVLIEGIYENEHDAKPELIRRQAYQTMLSGGCGQFLGNCPIWHFGGPGVFPPKMTWQKAMDGQGSWDMVRLRNVLLERPWHQLIPDGHLRVATDGIGSDAGTATTAQTSDRKLAMSYIPDLSAESRELTIDFAQMAGPVTARWYDPTNGRFQVIKGSPFANQGRRTLRTPGKNFGGCGDWLLVLEAK